MFSIVLLALVVPGLELLPEPALVHQLLLVVGLRRENIQQMRKFRVNTEIASRRRVTTPHSQKKNIFYV